MAKSKKILIVDDDKDTLRLVEDFLLSLGYDTDLAVDGKEGFTKAKHYMPHLVLLGMALPKIDGLEVLSKIKRNRKTKKIPVVMFTNFVSETSIKDSMDLGSEGYLIRANHSLEELAKKISKMI